MAGRQERIPVRRMWRSSWLALLLGVALPAVAQAPGAPAVPGGSVFKMAAGPELPMLGDLDAEGIDLGDERRLGDRIMRDIRRDPAYLDDAQLGDYLERIWQPLLQTARLRGEITPDLDRIGAWELFQVQDRSVNAFALPGAYVGVHLGLVALTTTADELAAVLAHELTHVTQRHIARGMVSSRRLNLASTAAVLLGLLLATRSASGDAAQALIVGGQAAAIQGQLNFSREMEREADRIGWQLLTGAGFAPGGMAAMFEKLDHSNRLNDSNQYPYLRSHPLTIERIAEARLRSSGEGGVSLPPGMALDNQPPSLAEHAVMQARSRVLMDTSEPALRRAQQQGAPGSPELGPARLGALYAAALASHLLREPALADRTLAAAQALVRQHHNADAGLLRALELLHLEMRTQRPQATGLVQAVENGPLAREGSRAALLLRAQAALAAQRAGEARAAAVLSQSVQTLQTWLVAHKRDGLAWQTLAQVAQVHGQPLRAARAAAEASAIRGDVQGAIDRLRTAQQTGRADAQADYVEMSIIQSRLRELEAERRRQMAEARGE